MAVYICTDLHGHLEIYHKIKNYIKPEDTVYFLGDAGDRGPQSWECIKTIYNDPQFIYLKGNHEDMLVKACGDYLDNGKEWSYYSYQLSYRNGGGKTMESWEHDSDRVNWINKIALLPTFAEYVNKNGKKILMSHAGFTPWLPDDGAYDYADIPDTDKLIWDREHFYDDWEPDMMEDCIVAHGHTPTIYIADDLIIRNYNGGALWYCDNHKVCIDTGGFFMGEFCMLNADTFEEVIFELD